MKGDFEIQLWKDRFKNGGIAAAIIALFIVMGIWFLPPLGESTIVVGEVTGLRAREGDGAKLFLTVRLDSSQEVLVNIPRTGEYYRKGKRVKLLMMEPKAFGATEYRFQHYVFN